MSLLLQRPSQKKNLLQNFCLNCFGIASIASVECAEPRKIFGGNGRACLPLRHIHRARPTARNPMEAWFTGPRQY